MPTSIRLDPRTQLRLARLAKSRGQTKSQVIRDAIHALEGNDSASGGSCFDAIQHLVGVVSSDGLQLSEASGRQFAEKLRRAKGSSRGRGPA